MLTTEARVFAIGAHSGIGQVRRHDNSAYWKHPVRVANILTEAGIRDENTLAAAYLHDVLEDTKTTVNDLMAVFPADVVKLVVELTDVYQDHSFGNRKFRKEMEAKRLWNVSVAAQNVKLADFLDNWASIKVNEPKFAKTFMEEKAFTVRGFDSTKLNQILFDEVNKEITNFFNSAVYIKQ